MGLETPCCSIWSLSGFLQSDDYFPCTSKQLLQEIHWNYPPLASLLTSPPFLFVFSLVFSLNQSLWGAAVGISNAQYPLWVGRFPLGLMGRNLASVICTFFCFQWSVPRWCNWARAPYSSNQVTVLQHVTCWCCKLCWQTWFLQRAVGYLQGPGSYLQAPLWPETWAIVLFIGHTGGEDNFHRKESCSWA